MNVRATRLSVAGLAGVILALTLHVFMLVGMSAGHPPADDYMAGMAAVDAEFMPASDAATHDAGGHTMAGCFAVLAGLALIFRLAAAGSATGTTVQGGTDQDAASPIAIAEDLPPPAGPLVAAGVLLRV